MRNLYPVYVVHCAAQETFITRQFNDLISIWIDEVFYTHTHL